MKEIPTDLYVDGRNKPSHLNTIKDGFRHLHLINKIKSKIHPATRVFQALRIEVNKELLNFENTLLKVINLCDIGAIISLLSFHSLEDRAVKLAFNDSTGKCICPPGLPYCMCGAKEKSKGKIIATVVTGNPS